MQTNFSSVTKSLSLTELDNLQSYKQIGQQLKKIQGSDTEEDDQFGFSVAVSNTRIVVGATGKDTTASNAGAAYIFDIDGNEIKKIQAFDPPGTSDAQADDYFGVSVAVSDTRIVVGAQYEDTGGSNAGSAYIFDINGNEIKKIQAFDPPGTNDAEAGDNFGRSVAVSNTRIVVGATGKDTTASNAGAAYIFDIDGNEIAKIQAFDPPGTSDAQADDYFGVSVAVSDTRIVVGARGEDTTADNAGSAYIFDIDGNGIAKIQAFDPPGTSDAQFYDGFGSSVAVSNTRIVVGAGGKNTTEYSDVGAAYIFDIDGNEIAKIQADDAEQYDYFGDSVAVSDTRIVVGAQYEDTGDNGAGAAYIFDINGTQLAKIQASDIQFNDYFGHSVAVSDTRIVVGAIKFYTIDPNAGGNAYIFSTGFSPFGDLCAYYALGDPTVLDTNFSWSDYT